MLLSSRLESSAVNGPGNRAVVWTQGCMLHCPGCWNPDTHSFDGKGEWVSAQDLAIWVLNLRKRVVGVTFSGGEPIHQIDELLTTCGIVRAAWPDVSFGMFTGYNLEELEKGNYRRFVPRDPGESYGMETEYRQHMWQHLKAGLDFAVMGRYVRTLPSDLPLLGSSNQKVMFFTNRYSDKDLIAQQMEIHINEGGSMEITGFPRADMCPVRPYYQAAEASAEVRRAIHQNQ